MLPGSFKAQGEKKGAQIEATGPKKYWKSEENCVQNPQNHNKKHEWNLKFCDSGPLYFSGLGHKFAGRVLASQLWYLRNKIRNFVIVAPCIWIVSGNKFAGRVPAYQFWCLRNLMWNFAVVAPCILLVSGNRFAGRAPASQLWCLRKWIWFFAIVPPVFCCFLVTSLQAE